VLARKHNGVEGRKHQDEIGRGNATACSRVLTKRKLGEVWNQENWRYDTIASGIEVLEWAT